MALNLLKLCVGVETVEDLEASIARRIAGNGTHRPFHTTRMVPRRAEELLEGGSLYWVIRGNVQARQRLEAIDPFTDAEGISRCRLVLDPALQRTRWQPRRPFQGWRYLAAKDAPPDLGADDDMAGLPGELQRELADLGLL
ncbi:DUF1489 family protein [Pararhizobium mangrovi]|uniref:DUF1489 family protein n=1 Tax=Pararhizobium mangrovi TaxID=2590452 RepID=A0A506UEL5_9HYPH|nr:DUF1489 domain-containing protein [Pararhizobium mangrovi]TPW31199.1 DUF1489 family protein [Pararhizobium mangrovi]